MDDRRRRVERQPAVEPAHLPVAPGVAAPARGWESAWRRARRRRPGPERRVVVAAGRDEGQELGVPHRCRVDLERRDAHRPRRLLVVEREAALAGARGRARRRRRRCAGGRAPAATAGRDRSAPASRAWRAARRTLRRACPRGRARGGGSSSRRRRPRSRGMASMQASSWRREPLRQLGARRQRDAPALAVGEPGRIEDRVGAGDRGGFAAATKPSAPATCGPRRIQNSANQARWPSSQATG